MTYLGAITVRSVSDRRKPTGPNSISSSPTSATAASVESNGRYARERPGQPVLIINASKSRAILFMELNDARRARPPAHVDATLVPATREKRHHCKILPACGARVTRALDTVFYGE